MDDFLKRKNVTDYNVRKFTPKTLDDKSRTVDVVVATETPVDVWTPKGRMPEILLMNGFEVRGGRDSVPLLDSHDRYSTRNIKGSVSNFRVDGDALVGTAKFSSTAEDDFTKVAEGHLTDVSVGAKRLDYKLVETGETKTFGEKEITGPAIVVTRWSLAEVSLTPVGADKNSVVRTEKNLNQKEFFGMPEEKKKKDEKPDVNRTGENTGDVNSDVSRSESSGGESPQNDFRTKNDDIADAIRAERERVAEINAICRQFDVDPDEFVRTGDDVNTVRGKVLDIVAERIEKSADKETPYMYMPPARIGADERDKFTRAAEDGLAIRAGLEVENPAPGSDVIAGFTLRELARESLRIENIPAGANPYDMINRAMTTDSFPVLMSNLANKSLFEGWNTASETWSKWCATGRVSDFKTHTSARLSAADDLDQITEGQEYKYGETEDAAETYSVATYGKLYAITRETIINDDLNALTSLPRKHGEAAARKVGDVAYSALIANATMGDGIALFHADHKNIGTAGSLGANTIAEAIKLMKLQKDKRNLARLNISPRFVIAPVALEGSHEIFFNSQMLDVASGSQQRNPYAGSRFIRVYEPRLDDDSATAYYFAAEKGKTVTVFFLAGQSQPYLEKRRGWSVDGIEYKVRIDCGAKAMDWRGLLMNAGV